jgi:hypothetical protein
VGAGLRRSAIGEVPSARANNAKAAIATGVPASVGSVWTGFARQRRKRSRHPSGTERGVWRERHAQLAWDEGRS